MSKRHKDAQLDKEWVIIGCFGKPHGVEGMIRIISFTVPIDNLLAFDTWYKNKNGKWQPFKIMNFNLGNRFLYARLADVNSREEAELLVNAEIATHRASLPKLPEAEYYWHDLLNLKVITEDKQELGVVVQILPTGAHDVLVVQGEKRVLIPFVMEHYIKQIDLKSGIIVVDSEIEN